MLNIFSSSSKISSSENRMLAPWPDKITLNFPKQFDQYYLDHLPGRSVLLKEYAKVRSQIFKLNEKVFLGENDWFFYNSKPDGDTLADFLGTNLFDTDELKRIVDRNQCVLNEFGFDAKNNAVLIAPNKSQIYFEYMPEVYRAKKANSGRLEQVEAEFKRYNLNIISVKDILLSAKSVHPTYYRTDSHWNSYGSFLAFKEIIRYFDDLSLFNKANSKASDNWKPIETACGDIYTNMLGFNDPCVDIEMKPSDDNYYLTNIKCEIDEKLSSKNIVNCLNSKSISHKKIIIIGDSFMYRLLPHFNYFYRDTIALHRNKNRNDILEIVKTEKPDILIFETAERYIDDMYSYSSCGN